MTICPDDIPEELRQGGRWCGWRLISDAKGKPQKRPWRLDGMGALAWGNPANLSTFEEVIEAYEAGLDLEEHKGKHFSGIGYILPGGTTEPRFICIDLDDCILEDEELSPGAVKILERFGGYVERSPSGHGLHIWITATLPEEFKNISTKDGGEPLFIDGQKVEVFIHKHFVTFTGNIYRAGAIEDRTSAVLELCALKAEDGPSEPSRGRSGPVGDRHRRYAEAALESAVRNVRDAQEGNRNNTLNSEAFGVGQLVGAGLLDDYEVERALFRAATTNGLPESEARATIRSGLEAGKREPRDVERLEDYQKPEPRPDREPIIERAVKNIMDRGNVLKFVVRRAQKNHVGDTDVIKHLFASVACTNSLTSSGIQPELNGEKGHGKTDAVKAVFHCIPDKWKLAASISAKSLYYHKNLLAGSIIFSDDVEWSPDLIATVKRSMGSFQEPQTHFTLDKNRTPQAQVMPARLVWWLSSVESVADDQLKDRQYSLDIDEGNKHAEEVSDYLRCSRSKKEIRYTVDWRVDVAREIVSQIKEHEPFKVVIPCAEHADWKVKEDHRTQNKFWDLVEAFAILRFKQRYIDADGWLHATIEDFNEAKTIFMKRKANHRTHLTNAQTKIVKSVIALQKEDDGATRARIAEDLGISFQAVSKALKTIEANTRFIVHEPGPNGKEFYRCTVSGLEVVYGEGDIVTLPDGYKDPFNLVKPPFNLYSTSRSTSKTTHSNNKHTYIQPNKVEYSNGDDTPLGSVQVEPKDCSAQKTGLMRLNKSSDIDNQVEMKVESMVESTIEVELHQAEGRREEKEAHFRDMANKHQGDGMRPDEHIICAVCGEDLRGKGQMKKDGKYYCPKPGCGHPPRGEVVT